MKFILKKKNNKRGIALFVAVLITSVALLFSYAITNIAVKELTLTQAGRDSQIAFYASNTGIECALFHDLRNDAFNPDIVGDPTIECVGRDVSIDAPGVGVQRTFTSGDFWLTDDQNGPCFNLTIIKDELNGDIVTTTESRGYNTCTPNSPRRLERALRATY